MKESKRKEAWRVEKEMVQRGGDGGREEKRMKEGREKNHRKRGKERCRKE